MFDLMDTDNVLINSALVQRDLLDQVMSTFESLVPSNFAQVYLCSLCGVKYPVIKLL